MSNVKKVVSPESVIDILMDLGLTLYKSKIYRSLFIIGPTTISDISAHSGVPANKIYKLIRELEDDGFITEKIPVETKTPKIYQAVNPKIIEKNMLDDINSKLDQMKNHLTHWKDKHSQRISEEIDYLIVRNEITLKNQLNEILNEPNEFEIYYINNQLTIDYINYFKNTFKNKGIYKEIDLEKLNLNQEIKNSILYLIINDYLINSLKISPFRQEYFIIQSKSFIALQKALFL